MSAGKTQWSNTRLCLVLLAALAIGAATRADGVADGKAGMDALNRKDYDEAIRLFTRALQPGRLKADDREFAYLNRGDAYAGKQDYVHAIADLKEALRLKPDDPDAQQALDAATAMQQGALDDQDAAPVATGPGGAWGLLANMAGRYYWYQVPGKDAHEAYVQVAWVMPQKTLSLIIKTKSDQLRVQEFKIDDKSNEVIYAAVVDDQQQYGTSAPTRGGQALYTYVSGVPTREMLRQRPDGSMSDETQTYADGRWKPATSAALTETTVDELVAQGLVKAKKR
jgi:tetratricopeptide (TPR) repeat protein